MISTTSTALHTMIQSHPAILYLSKPSKTVFYHHVFGPNVSPGGAALSGTPFQSAVFVNTVFPHHASHDAPIVPSRGYTYHRSP